MALLDFLYPKRCLGCGFLGAYICSSCFTKLIKREKEICLYCKKRSLYGLTHPICHRKYGVDGVISLFEYNRMLRKIVWAVKYRFITDSWTEVMLNISVEIRFRLTFFKTVKTAFVLQPIPLHEKKLRWRGFNQAFLIASFLSSTLNFPVVDLLERSKDTKPQVHFHSPYERFKNIKGAFRVKTKEGMQKNIILVDDVVTSGSTIKAAASPLKRAGAQLVYAVTLAAG